MKTSRIKAIFDALRAEHVTMDELEVLLRGVASVSVAAQEEINETAEEQLGKQEKKEKLLVRVTGMLHEIGIPAHIKGYKYSRNAVLLAIEKPTITEAITKELYPAVAKEFKTTASRVERAIRHAIEVAWDRGQLDVFEKYFGYTISPQKGKPTNGEFIAMMADYFRLEDGLET